MDCRVAGEQVEPLLCRVEYERPAEWDDGDDRVNTWSHDDAGLALAYTVAERDEITHELDAADITYKLVAEDQPEAELLAKLHGRVSSRTEALVALQAGKAPTTVADLEARITELEANAGTTT